ncbi:MAG: FkbM family methyltransferase [Lachnospiraceae bacterium]|nr:FkbM family methyltransferase [Lachnospiraceae bacterium]
MSFIKRIINYIHSLYIHSDVWKRKLKKEIKEYFASNEYGKYKSELNYIQNKGLEVFNYDFTDKYCAKEIEISCDDRNGLKYLYDDMGHKLYFPRKMSKKQIVDYYRTLLMEQDDDSPHKYLDAELQERHYDTVLDLGGAEGNFALSVIEHSENVYIFEYDEDWVEALRFTFEPWKEKVHIIKRFVSDYSRGDVVKLDDIESLRDSKIDLIKMDIEGEELNALIGAKSILDVNPQCVLLLCVYHKANDYKEITNYLEGYRVQKRKNKILFIYDKNIKPPYFRYGVIKACRG